MADITITDSVALSVSVKVPDQVPLAKLTPKQLVTTERQFFESLNKPIDQADVQSVALGGTFTSPQLLSGDLALTVAAGINCGLTVVKPANKLLFADDGFSPLIPIDHNEAWLGFDVDLTFNATAAATENGLCVSVGAASQIGSCTWTRFSVPEPPLPSLLASLQTTLTNFSVTTSATSIREQVPNTVNTTEVSGSIKASVSLTQPFNLNPLASAHLPFNEVGSIQPSVTLSLGTSLKVAGDFVVRSYKLTPDLVRLGVYKKQGTVLTVNLTAAAGLGADIGSDDVLSTLLNKALPGIDVAGTGITGDNARKLNDVIKTGLSRSLSAQVNATCSAATTHEAAVLYEVQLNSGDSAATDHALQLAVQGDWTALETLPNARCLRNIAVETVEKKRSIAVNLFGFYSATSTTDYLKSCTILVDDSGQLSITDKEDASRISASTDPNASDPSKLRQALMEDFLCTATYAAICGKLQLKLTAMQSYLDYNRNMGPAEMRQNLCLLYALGLRPPGSLDEVLTNSTDFKHAYISAVVRYDMPAVLNIFYLNPDTQTTRSRQDTEQEGRDIMCLFLNPSDPTDAIRLSILKNDAVWQQMDDIGNTAAFHTIADLGPLGPTQLGAVSADWVSIVWWAKALSKVAPALTAAMATLNSAPATNPTNDPAFVKARVNLANVLGSVTRDTDAAFVHGWGAAVLFALSGKRGTAQMDLTWNSKSLHLGP